MTRLEAATSHGVAVLYGRFATFAPDRPLIFAIPGAFQSPERLMRLPDRQPDCDVVIAALPGMFSPTPSVLSIAGFAAMFDEVLAGCFPHPRVLRVGVSVGGLVAMAMKRGGAFVAVDSPLATGPLWVLHEAVRRELGNSPSQAPWAWNILGIGPDTIEDRDYRHLLADVGVPGVYLIAGQPLEPERPVERSPGAISAADRDLIAARPGVTAIVVAGKGHALLEDAPAAVQLAIARGLDLL